MKKEIEIIPFEREHQNGIDLMMKSIAQEFEEPIFTPQSKKIVDIFTLPNNTFWVAISDKKVVGTIGMTSLLNGSLVLKSMFVDKMYRGHGISNLLLDTLTNWAIENKYKHIYLGTMTQFVGGQRFYEKNGFTRCTLTDLPTDFAINPLDIIFYTKSLE